MAQKFYPRARLARILNRRGKNTVVFTNGCFDILHAGHVRLLEKARKLGDKLVVAINSDRSLKNLKGSGRPLAPERARTEVLSALNCVDYVTIFPDPTPAETIKLLKPDILVKGADYKIENIVGRQYVKRVVRIPLVRGFSTSGLIQKILKAYGGKK